MVSEVGLIAVAATAVITGAPAWVVNVALGEVAERLPAFAETTSKLYAVLEVSPVMVTECEVVRVLLRAEDEP